MSESIATLLAIMSATAETEVSSRSRPEPRADDRPSFDQELAVAQVKPERPAANDRADAPERSINTDPLPASTKKPAEAEDAPEAEPASEHAKPDQPDQTAPNIETQPEIIVEQADFAAVELTAVPVVSGVETVDVAEVPDAAPEGVQEAGGEYLDNTAAPALQQLPAQTEQEQITPLPEQPQAARETVELDQEPTASVQQGTEKELPQEFDNLVKAAIETAQAPEAPKAQALEAEVKATATVAVAAAEVATDETQNESVVKTAANDELPEAKEVKPTEQPAKVEVKPAAQVEAKEQVDSDAPQRARFSPATQAEEQAAAVHATNFAERMPGASAQVTGIEQAKGVLAARGLTPADVMSHLSRQAAMTLRNGRGEVNVQIYPPELGSVRVRLSAGVGNLLNVQIVAEQEGTRALIERHLDELRASLQRSGVKVSDFDVSTQSGRHSEQQDDQPQWREVPGRTPEGVSRNVGSAIAAAAGPTVVGLLNIIA